MFNQMLNANMSKSSLRVPVADPERRVAQESLRMYITCFVYRPVQPTPPSPATAAEMGHDPRAREDHVWSKKGERNGRLCSSDSPPVMNARPCKPAPALAPTLVPTHALTPSQPRRGILLLTPPACRSLCSRTGWPGTRAGWASRPGSPWSPPARPPDSGPLCGRRSPPRRRRRRAPSSAATGP